MPLLGKLLRRKSRRTDDASSEKVQPEAPRKAAVSDSAMQALVRGFVIVASAIIILAGMKAAAPILTNILIILFLAIVISPIYDFLRKLGIPSGISVALLIVALISSCLYLTLVILPAGVMEFANNAREYWAQAVDASHDLRNILAQRGVSVPDQQGWDQALSNFISITPTMISGIAIDAVKFLGQLVSNIVSILIVTSFLICEIPTLPSKAKSAKWMTPSRWAVLSRFVKDVRHYMGIKTIVSAATGVGIWVGLRILGVDSSGLLGIIAFLMNFIPVFGSIIAAIPGILLALSGGGVETAIWTLLLYIATNQIIGNVIEPRVMGTGFGVSPVLVLLSVLFWGWILGPVGMILAVPITMAVNGAISSILEERQHNSESNHSTLNTQNT